MASSSPSTKLCFNSTCKEVLEVPSEGWRCRTGDFADLCDRCSSAFKDGKFCDTYHLNSSGWRCCESCGKQIHCGCIVSFHMFILLDGGGIECLNCAKTEHILTPNPTWPSASHLPGERIRDISSKNWRSIAGSGPVPWQQAPSLFNASKIQPEFQSKTPFDIDKSLSKCTREDPSERLMKESWYGATEMIGDRARATGVQYDGQRKLLGDVSYQSLIRTDELVTPLSSLPATFVGKSEQGLAKCLKYPLPSAGKRCSSNNGTGPCLEARGQHQQLPRYWPRITDQELQQISGGSNAKITPLFEKVLSASDAGRIGRLVLPKKCAEAYLPPISQPEGFPLVIQDLKGKDWVLQFRFWPNNNSRMYVLEGVTPCIQSMQLQAGDTVTFSRLEPEGKLIMGFRKVSPSDQANETRVSTHDESSMGGIVVKSKKPDCAKRKRGGKIGLESKQRKLNITLEQVLGLLQPPPNVPPTIVVIDGVEIKAYPEPPIIGSPTNVSTNHVGSFSSFEEEPTPEHPRHIIPMINHENEESVKTMEGLDALVDVAPSHSVICVQSSPSASKHKPTCTCNLCLAVKRSTQHDLNHSDGNPVTQLIYEYDQTLQHFQMGNNIQNHETRPSGSFQNDPSREQPSFKSQNIDLNIQPEREEESSPVQESTHIYIKQQKISVNGGNQENHHL